MSPRHIKKYQPLLKLEEGVEIIKIDHPEAMVATVYKIIRHNQPSLIFKICESPSHYSNEVYFLQYFSKQIPVPKVLDTVSHSKDTYGAVLMEYLPGNLLTSASLTKEVSFEIGRSLAIIHENKPTGLREGEKNSALTSHPAVHFKEKFEEEIEECKDHLPPKTLTQIVHYFKEFFPLLESLDGPCIIHGDFRPGNILIEKNNLKGIIDWSSARFSFAEEDFCPLEHGEWGDFNGYKNVFFEGYASMRAIPNYEAIMPLLRLTRALAVIGFTVKRGTWNTLHAQPYQFNRNYLNTFLKKISL